MIDLLEGCGFRELRGAMHALFVDGRCGLIASRPVSICARAEPEKTVSEILAQAIDCHAEGIILATNDLEGKIVKTVQCSKLERDLYRKGEAIETFLLDHFILTANGWKRGSSFNARDHR